MIAIIQRVSEASVTISSKETAKIGDGLMVLLGISVEDRTDDIQWLVKKIVNLRIFNDQEGVMNRSLLEIKGEILVISQFTLLASTKKGNRPSYIRAAPPQMAIPLYEEFLTLMKMSVPVTRSGEFGADMKVQLINDGPVTITIDTKNKK
jgi:D-tyrosyl-tRNA(Tyr) deacylase